MSNIFNEYFCSVATQIGIDDKISETENLKSIIASYETHPSILSIKENAVHNDVFRLSLTTHTEVLKLLKRVNPKKATGYDNIPPKLLKIAATEFAYPIYNLINISINASHFPAQLKKAEVSALYKAKDSLDTTNYRPISILPSISKIYERIFYDQLYCFFNNIFTNMLAAYRPKYGCQHVITKLIEDWKTALDNKKNIGAILMDLSKAFDCIPHRLLICKLQAYGVLPETCELIKSYLQDRMQRVKMGPNRSEWKFLSKGVPQGSILGPLLFNIFVHDIFYCLGDTSLYNFADDNTLSKCHI